MARGKQAAKAANRRAEAAHQVIDRLTSELADAKIRAKKAEERADRLEGVEDLLRRTRERDDELINAMVETIHSWQHRFKREKKRSREAVDEIRDRLMVDVIAVSTDFVTGEDEREFIFARYPRIIASILGDDVSVVTKSVEMGHPKSSSPGSRRFSGEALKKFQKLVGQRATLETRPDADASELIADLLDVKVGKMTSDELEEQWGGV